MFKLLIRILKYPFEFYFCKASYVLYDVKYMLTQHKLDGHL